MATPYALVSYERTTSTQDDARDLIGEFPVLVTAREQTAGRGRSGAGWENAPVALAASLAFRPAWPTEAWSRITLLAGLAAARSFGREVSLKWPNDVMIEGDKVAGLLTEAKGDVVVVGCGVNLHWPQAPDGYGALYDDKPSESAAVRLAQRWAEELLDLCDEPADDWPMDEYRQRSSTIGTAVTWQPSGTGTAVDIDVAGGLIVDTGTERVTITAGAVNEVRPA